MLAPRLGQSGDLDADFERRRAGSADDALDRRHVVVVAAAADHDVPLADRRVVGRIVGGPFAEPPLHPGVALSSGRLADRRVLRRMQVPRHVARRNAEMAQRSYDEVDVVLAYTAA